MKIFRFLPLLLATTLAQAHTGYLCSVEIRSFDLSFESLTGNCYGQETPNLLIFEIAPHAVNLVGTKLGVQAASRAGEIQNIKASGQSLQILGSLPMGEDAACGSGAFQKTGELGFQINVTSDTGLDVTDPDYSLEASGQVTFTQTLLDGSVHQIQAPIDCNDND